MSYTLDQSYFIFRIISSNLTPKLCGTIFGKNLETHMWEKWLYYDMDIIKFLKSLDSFNRKKLFSWAENAVVGDAKFGDRF